MSSTIKTFALTKSTCVITYGYPPVIPRYHNPAGNRGTRRQLRWYPPATPVVPAGTSHGTRRKPRYLPCLCCTTFRVALCSCLAVSPPFSTSPARRASSQSSDLQCLSCRFALPIVFPLPRLSSFALLRFESILSVLVFTFCGVEFPGGVIFKFGLGSEYYCISSRSGVSRGSVLVRCSLRLCILE